MKLSKYYQKRARFWQPVLDSRGNYHFINKENERKRKIKLIAFFSWLGILFLTGLAILFLTSCEPKAEPTQISEPTLIKFYRQDTKNLKMFIFKQQKLFL